jgi:hypothetical protein
VTEAANESSQSLREQAAHCRKLATAPCTEGARTILENMARDLDERALASEAAIDQGPY